MLTIISVTLIPASIMAFNWGSLYRNMPVALAGAAAFIVAAFALLGCNMEDARIWFVISGFVAFMALMLHGRPAKTTTPARKKKAP